jgi:hypothetical protein
MTVTPSGGGDPQQHIVRRIGLILAVHDDLVIIDQDRTTSFFMRQKHIATLAHVSMVRTARSPIAQIGRPGLSQPTFGLHRRKSVSTSSAAESTSWARWA